MLGFILSIWARHCLLITPTSYEEYSYIRFCQKFLFCAPNKRGLN